MAPKKRKSAAAAAAEPESEAKPKKGRAKKKVKSADPVLPTAILAGVDSKVLDVLKLTYTERKTKKKGEVEYVLQDSLIDTITTCVSFVSAALSVEKKLVDKAEKLEEELRYLDEDALTEIRKVNQFLDYIRQKPISSRGMWGQLIMKGQPKNFMQSESDDSENEDEEVVDAD